MNEEAKLRKACALHDAGAITNEEFLKRIRINEMTNEYSTEKFCAFHGSAWVDLGTLPSRQNKVHKTNDIGSRNRRSHKSTDAPFCFLKDTYNSKNKGDNFKDYASTKYHQAKHKDRLS